MASIWKPADQPPTLDEEGKRSRRVLVYVPDFVKRDRAEGLAAPGVREGYYLGRSLKQWRVSGSTSGWTVTLWRDIPEPK